MEQVWNKAVGLSEKEKELLLSNRNYSEDHFTTLKLLEVAPNEERRLEVLKRIRDSEFYGRNVLILPGPSKIIAVDRSKEKALQISSKAPQKDEFTVEIEGNLRLPSGIYRSVLINSVVDLSARVSNCETIQSCVVEEGAALLNCGILTCSGEGQFGVGFTIPLGISAGGREATFFPDMTFNQVTEAVLTKKRVSKDLNSSSKFVKMKKQTHNVISKKAVLRKCFASENFFLGENVVVINSTIKDSYIDKGSRIENSSMIESSILQSHCLVTGAAIVRQSFLCSSVEVNNHAKVVKSCIASLNSLNHGEVSYSLVGPLTGFNHTATLTGALFPQGKGNISLGCWLGSNHTGKKPDQEMISGEGVFFGLGAKAKYPLNLSEAPYTLIAADVTLLPQRVSFPFSLISTPLTVVASSELVENLEVKKLKIGDKEHGGRAKAKSIPVSPAFNFITPGWVLSDSVYTVFRNEFKFQSRSKKLNMLGLGSLEGRIFRPTIFLQLFLAWERLRVALEKVEELFDGSTSSSSSAGVAGLDTLYVTERTVKGIGKNLMTVRSLKTAVETYKFWVQFSALDGLLKALYSEQQERGTLKQGAAAEKVVEKVTKFLKQSGSDLVKITAEEVASAINTSSALFATGLTEPVQSSAGPQASSSPIPLVAGSHLAEMWAALSEQVVGNLLREQALGSLKESIVFLQTRYKASCEKITAGVLKAKRKDDVRGVKVVDDYQEVHVLADADDIVVKVTSLFENRAKSVGEGLSAVLLEL